MKKKKVIKKYLILLVVLLLNIFLMLNISSAQVCSEPQHCGLLSEGNLCRITNGNPSILPASTFDNDIFLNQCQNAEYVSDGNNWISCLSGQYILKGIIGAHDYFCNGTEQRVEEEINDLFNITKGNGQGSIIECCGSGLCNSNNAGIRLSTGQSITVDKDIPKITQTCPDDEILVGLDAQNNIICEETIIFLVDSQLTPQDCISDSGEVVNIGQGSICKFSGIVCPEGWAQFGNFITTADKTCRGSYDGQLNCNPGPARGCGGSAILCSGSFPTLTAVGQPLSEHTPNRVTGTAHGQTCGPACGPEHCRTVTFFCDAVKTQIGCH